jgi:hypothetical protein
MPSPIAFLLLVLQPLVVLDDVLNVLRGLDVKGVILELQQGLDPYCNSVMVTLPAVPACNTAIF